MSRMMWALPAWSPMKIFNWRLASSLHTPPLATDRPTPVQFSVDAVNAVAPPGTTETKFESVVPVTVRLNVTAVAPAGTTLADDTPPALLCASLTEMTRFEFGDIRPLGVYAARRES